MPNQGTRLVLKFFRGSDDFIMQNVYLLRLMSVYVGLIRVIFIAHDLCLASCLLFCMKKSLVFSV